MKQKAYQLSENERQLKVVVGYQGAVGSNSECASRNFFDENRDNDIVFVPLISSKNVASALLNNEIQYGAMAIRNSIGGEVLETRETIKNKDLEIAKETSLPIHHCLFKLPETSIDSIRFIASHIQALKQTQNTRANKYPHLLSIEMEDTAICAEWLRSGKLSSDTAVICSRIAGEINGLSLIDENIEDAKDNITTFGLFVLSTKTSK